MKKEIVFVTGSSRGIGRAIALYFAQNGHPVIINSSRSEQALLETKEAILSFGVPCLSFLCDIKDYNNVAEIFKETKEKLEFIAEREARSLSTQIDIILKEYIDIYFYTSKINWEEYRPGRDNQ